MTQKETDIAMLKMTILWGMNSKAKRMKVGALVVKNQQIISDGFNGTPSGFDNTCEENVTIELLGHGGAIIHQPTPELKTKEIVLHAESNAISKLAKHGSIGADGSTMYVTVAPCINCAKLGHCHLLRYLCFSNFYQHV
jgi:dCMP deaminase